MSLNWLRGIGHSLSNRSKPKQGKPVRRRRSHLHLEILEDRRLPSIFTVLNTNDSGNGSLRQAILDANRGPFTNTIAFNIGGGRVQTIMPTSALPTITNHVVIDGTTQPGFAGSPLIVLNGSHAGAGTDGLTITAGSSTVQALVINGFSRTGINLMTNGGNVIVGDYLGTDATGTMAVGNGGDGVFIQSNANVIGGTSVGARNLISENMASGISILGSGNTVQGNFIGTNLTGMGSLGNRTGVLITSSNNTIGGTVPGSGNLISGNAAGGVRITGMGVAANQVQGNRIGTNAAGTAALPNFGGVAIDGGAQDNTIGGSDPAARNLISGNFGDGILIYKNDFGGLHDTRHNVVQNNFMGTDIGGTTALGNRGTGINIAFSEDNQIIDNLVSGNQGSAGISVCAKSPCGQLTSNVGDASGTVLEGNRVGTDVSGTRAVGNNGYGIIIIGAHGTGVRIGGTTAAARNIISGNLSHGLVLSNSATATLIEGSYIGTDVNGAVALGNHGDGVRLEGTSGNTLGGVNDGAGNLISGNAENGVDILSGTGNVLQGNYIGTDVTGTVGLGNRFRGVAISSSNNLVGGTMNEARNVISANVEGGVLISSGSNDMVAGNFIGTDVTGTQALSDYVGVDLSGDSHDNLVGGTVTGAGNLISGNIIGVALRNGNVVQGNLIGTDSTGTQALGNGIGVSIFGSNSTVGGTAPGAGNIISGNTSDGIQMGSGNGNVVQGNSIGTDITGTDALGNANGVFISSSEANNTVGGTVAGAGNIISGNRNHGILMNMSSGNVIQGNYIGTDVTGSQALRNSFDGVNVFGGANNTIGGTLPGAGNLISGNGSNGVNIGVNNFGISNANVVQGNYIGTDVTGTQALGNGSTGVVIVGSGNRVGGTAAGVANLIAFNASDGVLVEGGVHNAILRNRIFGHHSGLGIGLINGGNQYQAFPTLTTAVFDGSTTTIAGILSSAPNTAYTIEIFVNSVCNPSGFGEGEQFFASLTIATDANGNAAFTLALPVAVDPGQFIAATATDPHGNTSEFSQCLEVTTPGQAGLSVAEFHEAVLPTTLGLPLSGETSFNSLSGTPAIPSVFLLPGDLGAAPLNRTVGQEGSDLFFGTDAHVHSEMDGFMNRIWDELTAQNSFFD